MGMTALCIAACRRRCAAGMSGAAVPEPLRLPPRSMLTSTFVTPIVVVV